MCIYILCIYIYIYIRIYIRSPPFRTEDSQACAGSAPWVSPCVCVCNGDDDKFTPTKHLILLPHHSSRPAAAHTGTETPLQQKGR